MNWKSICKNFDTSSLSWSLRWRPYVEATSVHIPRSFRSCHPSYIHWSWPQAEITRMARRSCTIIEFNNAKMVMLARFKKFLMPNCILQKCLDIQYDSRHKVRFDKPKARSTVLACRLVMPFRPLLGSLHKLVGKVLARWNPVIKFMLGYTFGITISWCRV